jgi:hypothetical protein
MPLVGMYNQEIVSNLRVSQAKNNIKLFLWYVMRQQPFLIERWFYWHYLLFLGTQSRNFGIIQEYNERKNKKLINNLLCTERPTYCVTSSRPSNFGDPLDTKTKADNWFDENRLWNEENRDYEIKRAQMYMIQGYIVGMYALGIKTDVTMIYNSPISTSLYESLKYLVLQIIEL